MVWKLAKWFGSWPNVLEAGRMVYKLAEWFTSWPNGLQAGQMVWKLVERFGSWPNGLEAGRMLWKLPKCFRSWLNALEAAQMLWKLQHESCPNNMKAVQLPGQLESWLNDLQIEAYKQDSLFDCARQLIDPATFWFCVHWF